MNAAAVEYDPFRYADRRAHPREAVHRRGRLMMPESAFSRPCLIRDVSDGGARVTLPAGWAPPEKLVLVDLATGKGFEARVAWIKGESCGLKLSTGYDLRGLVPQALFWAKSLFGGTTAAGAPRAFGRLP